LPAAGAALRYRGQRQGRGSGHRPHGSHARLRSHRHHRPSPHRPVAHAARIWHESLAGTGRSQRMTAGTVHLIPVGLGDAPVSSWLPEETRRVAARLDTYIAENAKTARAFLKTIGTERPLQEITIHTLERDTDARQLRQWLEPLRRGGEIGLVSEAGCPAVADPGAKVVATAHSMGLRVAPWVGPSSL